MPIWTKCGALLVVAALLLGCGLLGYATCGLPRAAVSTGSVKWFLPSESASTPSYAVVDLEGSSRVYGPTKKGGPPRSLLNQDRLGVWMKKRAEGMHDKHLSLCPVWYNDKYKIILLKTPKTAGSTLITFFTMCDWQSPTDYCFKTLDSGNATLVQHVLSKWSEYYVFTFSRNVFRRAISQYQYLTSSMFMEDKCRPSWKTFCQDPYILGDICQNRSSEGCCHQTAGHQYIHVMPQHSSLLTENNELAVDYIGRVEHFEEDFADLVRALNAREGVPRLPEYVPEMVNYITSNCTDGRRRLAYDAEYNPCNKLRFFDGENAVCAKSISTFFATDLMVLH